MGKLERERKARQAKGLQGSAFNISEPWQVVHVYTRAQAIADGGLFDVTDTEGGRLFGVPVAITAGLHADINDFPNDGSIQGEKAQDWQRRRFEVRLWDVMFVGLTLGSSCPKNELVYTIEMPVNRPGGNVARTKNYRVKMVVHGGDNGERVYTFMRRDES